MIINAEFENEYGNDDNCLMKWIILIMEIQSTILKTILRMSTTILKCFSSVTYYVHYNTQDSIYKYYLSKNQLKKYLNYIQLKNVLLHM